MKFVITTNHTKDWNAFAEITESVKREYCARHSYGFYTRDDNWRVRFNYGGEEGYEWGFERGYQIRDMFQAHPECEWVLFSDCDAIITNFTTTLDRLVDNRYHVILAADINGTNCGNIFVRNSEIGRAFVDSMIAAMPAYRDNPMAENQWIQEMATKT